MVGWYEPDEDPHPIAPDRMERFTDNFGGPSIIFPEKGEIVRHAHSDERGRLMVIHEHVDGHEPHEHEEYEA